MEWSTTEPSGAVWEQETKGDAKSFTRGTYFLFYPKCAIARLKNGRVCVRVQLYTMAMSGYSASQQATLWATVDGNQSDGEKVYVGDSYGLRMTWYAIFDADEGASIAAGTGLGTTVSTVTLFAPAKVGNGIFVNVNGTWKEATAYINVGGTWKEAQAKINVGGDWK